MIIKERVIEEILVNGIAIILLLMIGKNQNRIAKQAANIILFLVGKKDSFNIMILFRQTFRIFLSLKFIHIFVACGDLRHNVKV